MICRLRRLRTLTVCSPLSQFVVSLFVFAIINFDLLLQLIHNMLIFRVVDAGRLHIKHALCHRPRGVKEFF